MKFRLLRLAMQIAIVLLVVGPIYVSNLSSTPSSGGVPLALAQAVGVSDTCHGDETFSFAPPDPKVGQELLVAVTSKTAHSGLYMTATERVTAIRDTQGQMGFVYLWSVTPLQVGPHRFQLFVDFTKPCGEATIDVGEAPLGVMPGFGAGPTPIPTSTPFPTFTPENFNTNTDDNGNDSNDNDEDSDNNGNDSGTSDNNGNTTSTTKKLGPPVISSVNCTDSDTKEITITGHEFGRTQDEGKGKITFAKGKNTVTADNIIGWNKTKIVVLVPADVGPQWTIYVSTTGGSAKDGQVGNDCRNDV